MSPPSLLLANQLCFALYSTSLAMSQVYKAQLQPLGLTYSQYIVMLVLWEQDGVSVSDIGDRLFLDSGTLTPLLKRLERDGLLHRARDAEDERRVRVHLSGKGKQLREAARGIPTCVAAATGCSYEELITMKDSLERLRTQLRKSSNEAEAVSGPLATETTTVATSNRKKRRS